MVLACFKILEGTLIGFYRHESFQQSIAELGGGTWQGILTLALLVFAMLIPFVGYGELGKVLGEGKLEQIFFRPRPAPPGKFECIGQGRSAWCRKAELSCTLIQNTKEAPPWNLCITSGWTYTSARSATA